MSPHLNYVELDELPGLEELGPCTVAFTYHRGCADYFAGGCWNPGDPDELELSHVTPADPALGGEFCPLGPLAEWLGARLYEEAAEAEDDYDEPEDPAGMATEQTGSP